MIKNKFSDDGVKEFNELMICGGTIKPVNALPGKLRDEIKISPAKGGYRIDRNIKNASEGTVLLKELAVNITGITFDKNPEKDYYYSVENPRLFKNFTLPVDTDRFSVPTNESTAVTERVCNSPYQPFPAVLLSNYESNRGVVFGSLSQDVFFHSYKFSHENGRVNLTVYSSFKGIDEREIKAGEELSDVLYIGETRHAEKFTKIFEDYAQTLRGILLKKTGVKNANRYSLIWDSWNDGVYRDVNEKMLLEEAKAVKELFPAAEWFQLDDGYSKYCEKNVDLDAHGLGAAYEVDGIDEKKFPEGLKIISHQFEIVKIS